MRNWLGGTSAILVVTAAIYVATASLVEAGGPEKILLWLGGSVAGNAGYILYDAFFGRARR